MNESRPTGSQVDMRRSTVTVGWESGLHLRPAARLVRCAQKFQSTVQVSFRGQAANARNILSVIALCAAFGATLEIEVTGEDEREALGAVEAIFRAVEPGSDGGSKV